MFTKDGERYYKVFEIGKFALSKDPEGVLDEALLMEISLNYDPVSKHEAIFWAHHPGVFDSKEPRTGAYIKDVAAIGKELYVSFKEILPWLHKLYRDREFKRCSVEFRSMDFGTGIKEPYLRAICPTNIPAVAGLPQLDFTDEDYKRNSYSKDNDSIIAIPKPDFSEDFSHLFINSKPQKVEKLISLATAIGVVNASNFTDEDKLVSEINSKISDLKTSAQNFAQAKQELDAMKKERVDSLIEKGQKEGKFTPAESQQYRDLAEVNFTLAEKTISALPGRSELKKDADLGKDLNPKPTDSKFFKQDGTRMTYKDILDNQSLAKNFTDDELMQLRKESGIVPGL